MQPLVTFGHGRLSRAELAALVTAAEISQVVDVRRFPGSRANEAAAQGAVPDLMQSLGISYRWDERLGGRRSLRKADDARSPDTWWRVSAFRAYAAWTRAAEFRAAMDQLIEEAGQWRTAVMCSEAVWWRCHRRLIADVAMLQYQVPVVHLMHDGKLRDAQPSEGARTDAGGHLVWDGH